MQPLCLEEASIVAGGAYWSRCGPLQFQEQEGLVAHATRAANDRFDGRVHRLDDTEPHRVVTISRDAVDMLQQEVAKAFHFRQSLPPQRLEPAEQEVQDPGASLVGPEPIELLAQDVRFEEMPIGREELLKLATLRTAHGCPAAQQEPPLAASDGAHDGAGTKEFLAPHIVEGGRRMLQHVRLIEHHLSLGQDLRHGVKVGSVHVGTDRLDCGALPSIKTAREQPRQARLGTVARQAQYLSAYDVGEHGPETLTFAALDLVGAQVPRSTLWPSRVPGSKKCAFRPARLAPAHAMAHSGVARWHRLAVQPDQLAQAPSDPSLRAGKPDTLGPNPARATLHAPLPIDERGPVTGPRQVVPGPVLRIAHSPSPSPAPTTGVATDATALNTDPQSWVRALDVERHLLHPVSLQPQYPGTLSSRSHSVLPCLFTSREDSIGRSDGQWDRTAIRDRLGCTTAILGRPGLEGAPHAGNEAGVSENPDSERDNPVGAVGSMGKSRRSLARLSQAACGNPRLLRISTDAALSTALLRSKIAAHKSVKSLLLLCRPEKSHRTSNVSNLNG